MGRSRTNITGATYEPQQALNGGFYGVNNAYNLRKTIGGGAQRSFRRVVMTKKEIMLC